MVRAHIWPETNVGHGAVAPADVVGKIAAQDSSLESPAPEADAFSIRPAGQLIIGCVPHNFHIAALRPARQRYVYICILIYIYVYMLINIYIYI